MIEYEGLKFDEFEFRKDLPAIIHCLTAPEPQDDSEAEWEREEQLSSALVGWETKYNEELIEAVSDALDELVVNFCDAFLNG
jgi:hypothetical protein